MNRLKDINRATLATLLLALLLTGCAAGPTRPSAMPDAPLARIHAAFEETIAAAHNDSRTTWRSGWLGNAWVNLRGDPNIGLCYQWRDLVYHGVQPTVRQEGWEATGIVISRGTNNEHHAVVVYDPARISENGVMSATASQPVYVLDAWRNGRADIYPISVWLNLPLVVRSPAVLREPPETARHLQRTGLSTIGRHEPAAH